MAVAEGKLIWLPFLTKKLAPLGFPLVECRNPVAATDLWREMQVVSEFGVRRHSVRSAAEFDLSFRSYLQFCRY